MNTRKLITLLVPAVLVACGGRGGETQDAGVSGSSATARVSQGTITGFGSIIVNGVRYDTGSATISIDGKPGSEADLAVGQVVVVRGMVDGNGTTGTANDVSFDDAVEGPISEIDLAADTMVVLGQTVLITADTSFEDDIDPESLEGLVVGDIVEVSGFFDGDGNIVATHVELEDPGDEFEVTGFVSNHDPGAMTFQVNDLVVDYSSAMLDDFPNGAPEDGQRVEAKGDMLGPTGELLATKVEFEDNDMDLDDGDEVEIEGIITRFESATDFDVNGMPVTTTGQTEFKHGSSAGLGLHRMVEVEGAINSEGILVADEVEFEEEGVIRIEGTVDDIQGDQLTVITITVVVTNETEFDDDDDSDNRTFSLSDIRAGDCVDVRGFEDMGTVIATRLEREDHDCDTVELVGIVESVEQPDFTILDVTIHTDSNTEFDGDHGNSNDAGHFFANALGRLVETEGRFENGVILAEEVEIENDD